MRELFIGKPVHWAIWIAIAAVLFAASRTYLHVRAFNAFLVLVAALGLGAVLAVLLTSRPGEAITREPIGKGDWRQTGVDE